MWTLGFVQIEYKSSFEACYKCAIKKKFSNHSHGRVALVSNATPLKIISRKRISAQGISRSRCFIATFLIGYVYLYLLYDIWLLSVIQRYNYVYRLFCMAYFYIDVSEFVFIRLHGSGKIIFGFRITKETNMKMFVFVSRLKNGNFYF